MVTVCHPELVEGSREAACGRDFSTSLEMTALTSCYPDLNHADFRAFCAQLAANAGQNGKDVVPGSVGWLFLTSELRYMGLKQFWGEAAPEAARSAKPEIADPLPAILDFHAQLKAINVKLLIVPVPPKCLIFPDHLPMPDNQPGKLPAELPVTPAHARFYKILRDNGIRVLDLTDLFWKHRRDEHGAPYCLTDSHWSGNGCVLAAAAITEIIRGDLTTSENMEIKSEWIETTIKGDLTRMRGAPETRPERVRLRRVGCGRPGNLEPVTSDPDSSVILLGDSHNLVFHAGGDMHAGGAGLPDQLALELGRSVELIAVRGSGATPARINLYRRAARNPEYWRGRQWVVWCFAAREFSESDGWRKVPLRPE